ncbi:MAG: BamA/TamA family outer membrane protein [Acidobacteria bacterium]|nr:BamA/TamA family outer membrane protein [Acidobacteriota bacterium]
MRLAHALLALAALATTAFCNQDPETNVNSRYTVESAELPQRAEKRVSPTLKADVQKLVGEKFNQEIVDRLTRQMKKELRGFRVAQKVAKGTKPEHVRVLWEAIRTNPAQDLVLPRLVYSSKQNFTFGADADFDIDGNVFHAGILTDNDETLERYSGVRGGYRRVAAGGKFRGGFVVESYRAQWSNAVESALNNQSEVPGIYRTRLHVQPEVQVEVLPGVWIGAGISIQRMQFQFPAARYQDSHALISSLRFERRWAGSTPAKHGVEAGYSLRAATTSLGSDFSFTRHFFDARYFFRFSGEQVSAAFRGGVLSGTAPLYDRFVLGNSTTLRGYNKFDVAPLGGNRVAHGSLDYRHKWFRAVYDVGAVWSRGGESKVLHSLAAGVTTGLKRDSLSLLVAFPLREGRAEPIFIVGMNF